MDGLPVRVLAYRIPKDPTKDRWVPEVLDESLHVIHNFCPDPGADGQGHGHADRQLRGRQPAVSATATSGRSASSAPATRTTPRATAAPARSSRASSRTASRSSPPSSRGTATRSSSTPSRTTAGGLWDRHVIDDKLQWGHAVWCADLDGDGGDELIIGVRDDLSDKAGERCGVRIYKALDDKGAKWERQIIDDGGVAVEDLAAADLDGDGRIDIVAVGRATHNVRIYWNRGQEVSSGGDR